jgi:hypothetical protein
MKAEGGVAGRKGGKSRQRERERERERGNE